MKLRFLLGAAIAAVLPLVGLSETYTLAGKDKSSPSSSMSGTGTDAAGWTDSLGVTWKDHVPSEGNDYVANGPAPDFLLRTPTTSGFTFGGDSLTLSGGVEIKVKVPNNGIVTIPNLIVAGAAQIVCGDGNQLKKVAGAIEILEAGALKIDVSYDDNVANVRQFEIQSDVSGAGSLWSGLTVDGTKGEPYVRFTGSFADFTGKIVLGAGDTMRFATIFESDLPSDPDGLIEDGLVFEGKAALEFKASGKLGITRGVTFNSGLGEIFVAENETVQIDGQLVGPAGFKKTGKGTLALANVSPELMGTVTVAEGTLQLCDVKDMALPAADISVESGAVLDEHGPAVDHDPLVEATLTGVDVVADGQPHGPVLTVTEPASGYQVEWSVDSGAYTSTRPTFTDPGEHTIICRVSAAGYMTRKLRTAVVIRTLRRIVATEAEKEGDWANATVAGDDAWSAIQGVIDASGAYGLILVKAGTYLLTNELAFASVDQKGVTLRSDDGEGNLARQTTLFVGGYPATTNRLVRIAAPEVIVEGFTLTNGYVNATCGGGAYLDDCGADGGLRSCDIVGCTAWHEPFVKSAIDSSTLGTGGGVYIYKTGCVSNCLIRANTAFAGGGVYLNGTQQKVGKDPSALPRVTASTLVENQVVGYGTGNAYTGSALASHFTALMDRCTVVSNFCNVTAKSDYSTVGNHSGYLYVSDCVFSANHLGTWKTANLPVIGANNNNFIICTGTTFVREGTTGNVFNNSYEQFVCDGNGMIDCQGSLGGSWKEYRNCLFSGNTNKLCLLGTIKAENCTFVNNLGAIHSSGGFKTNRIANCVFYGNVNDIYAVNADNAKNIVCLISNCCISATALDRRQGTNRSFALIITNDCNIIYDAAKLNIKDLGFVAPNQRDLRLREDSPLLNAGMALDWMDGATDQAGQPRVVGPAPDIGCYERQEGAIDPPVHFVRAVATEADKKDEWADAYVGLQAAADAAYGETVYVKSGTYDVTKPVDVQSWGINLIGEDADKTIIDGGYPARTNRIFSINARNVTLSGLTIQNGLAYKQDGGGVYVNGVNFTMTNCVIRDCIAQNGGGVYAAVDCHGIVDCVFSNNLANSFGNGYSLGGGAYFKMAATVKACDFLDGETKVEGGGCYCNNVYVFADCVFSNNTTQTSGTNQKGGAFYSNGNNAGSFTGCSFLDNYAKENGGACFVNGSCTFESCQFVGNKGAGGSDGAIHAGSVANVMMVRECYFSHNGGPSHPCVLAGGNSVVTNCVFENQTSADSSGGSGIIGRAPDKNGSITRVTVTDCKFLDVYSTYFVDEFTDVENCVFSNVTAKTGIGKSTCAIRNSLFTDSPVPVRLGSRTYENCTIVNNAGGAGVLKGDMPVLVNTVVAKSRPYAESNVRVSENFSCHKDWTANSIVLTNSVIVGGDDVLGPDGTTHLDLLALDETGKSFSANPRFVDPVNGDWHLKSGSPLRDKGLVLDWMTDEATDLDGKPRRIDTDGKAYPDSLPDIGCYECAIPKPGLLLQVR